MVDWNKNLITDHDIPTNELWIGYFDKHPPSVCKLIFGDEKVSDDNVNHPSHYTAHPAGIECIDVVEHMTFNIGNAIKYLWRAGLKAGDPIEDFKKSIWYIQREINRVAKSKGKDHEKRTA